MTRRLQPHQFEIAINGQSDAVVLRWPDHVDTGCAVIAGGAHRRAGGGHSRASRARSLIAFDGLERGKYAADPDRSADAF
jgi:hypothetical protein